MAAEQAALVVCHGAGMMQSPMLACDCGVVLVGLAEALIYSQASAILVLRTPRLILGLSLCAVRCVVRLSGRAAGGAPPPALRRWRLSD